LDPQHHLTVGENDVKADRAVRLMNAVSDEFVYDQHRVVDDPVW